MNAFRITCCVVALVSASINTLHAGILVFDDRADFLNRTSAQSVTGTLPNLGEVTGGSIQLGSATISLGPSATRLFVGTNNISGLPIPANNDWTARLPGNDIAITGLENLNVGLGNDVFSFGFDFVEPQSDPNVGAFVDSTFSVRLLDDGIEVGAFSYNAPNDTAAFVGVWSMAAFDSVEIRETTGGVENEFFGEFYAGTAAVPEPMSAACLGSLALLGMLRRRRR